LNDATLPKLEKSYGDPEHELLKEKLILMAK
jgi:hypothetical protein